MGCTTGEKWKTEQGGNEKEIERDLELPKYVALAVKH
jgi:hypothetical protein